MTKVSPYTRTLISNRIAILQQEAKPLDAEIAKLTNEISRLTSRKQEMLDRKALIEKEISTVQDDLKKELADVQTPKTID